MPEKPRIVILGGGYAGVSAAVKMVRMGLGRRAEITLVNRSMLHYLTTTMQHAILRPTEYERVSLYLPELLGSDVRFVHGRIERIDTASRSVQVHTRDGSQELSYDLAVVALGWETRFYHIPGLAENAFVLKDIQDAHAIHDHVEDSFRTYADNPHERWRSHVLVGGAGLTGVEVISELAEWLPHLSRAYGFDPGEVQLTLVGGFMPGFDKRLADRALEILRGKGINVITDAMVEAVEPRVVRLKDREPLLEAVIIWAGGVRGNKVIEESGLPVDKGGRAHVNEFLQARDHPEMLIVGDCALTLDPAGKPVVQSAQFAVEEGQHAADNLRRMLDNWPLRPFVPRDLGVVVSLGRKNAIGLVRLGPLRLRVEGRVARFVKKMANYRYLWRIGALGMIRRQKIL